MKLVRYLGILFFVVLSCGVGFSQTIQPVPNYTPIPNYIGPLAGQQFRNDINNHLSGVTPIAPRLVSVPFNQLPTEVDAQQLYCTNCLQQATCQQGGTGAYVIGVNGQWNCSGASGGGSTSVTNTPICGQAVTLVSGSGTLSLSCINTSSVCWCAGDITNPSFNCYAANPPGAGSVNVTGNASDSVDIECTSTNLSNLAPANELPLLTGDFNLNNFRGMNAHAPTSSGDVLSEGNPIGSISPSTISATTLTASGTTTLNSLSTSGNTTIGGTLSVAKNTTLNGLSTSNSSQMLSGAYLDYPQSDYAYVGGVVNCGHTQFDLTLAMGITANIILSCSAVVNSDQTMHFRLFHAPTDSTATWNFSAAAGATYGWVGGNTPSSCSTIGCVDQVRVDYIPSANFYLLTLEGSNYSGSGGNGISACPSGGGTAYYVSNSLGSDSNTGLSPGQAWQTISKAETVLSTLGATNQTNPSGCILFKGGDTWTAQTLSLGDTLQHSVQGTVFSPVYIGTYGSGQAVFDENGNNYGVNAITPPFLVRYVTINNLEIRHAAKQAVTFQTFQGGMPGISIKNFYIHNNGPGCFTSSATCVGTSLSYLNQLDFEDTGFTIGSLSNNNNAPQFLSNIVKWNGGWNCLEVHGDTGAFLVAGNVVGPGCANNYIDVKASGSLNNQAQIKNNVVIGGVVESLCDSPGGPTCNQKFGYYAENKWNANTNIVWQGNIAYDIFSGLQLCPGGVPAGDTAGGIWEVYNNTFYAYGVNNVSNNVSASAQGCNGSSIGTLNPITLDMRNNIFDGGGGTGEKSLYIDPFYLTCTEGNNGIGGVQGNAGYLGCNGFTIPPSSDLISIDPKYASVNSGNFHLQVGSPYINTGVAGLTPGNNDIGAF